MRGRRLVLRLPLPSDPRHAFLAGSLAAHLVLVSSLMLLPSRGRRPALGGESLLVELAGSIPTGRAARPSAPAPPPKPVPSEEASVVKPQKRALGAPPPKALPREERKAPDRGDARSREKAEPAAAPSAAGQGSAATAGGVESMTLGGLELGWYGSAVTAALASRWLRPVLEGEGRDLVAVVAFDIRRDGTVENARVIESSGVPSLDRSALRAVLDASPLPPVPAAWNQPLLPAQFRFVWRPDEP